MISTIDTRGVRCKKTFQIKSMLEGQSCGKHLPINLLHNYGWPVYKSVNSFMLLLSWSVIIKLAYTLGHWHLLMKSSLFGTTRFGPIGLFYFLLRKQCRLEAYIQRLAIGLISYHKESGIH